MTLSSSPHSGAVPAGFRRDEGAPYRLRLYREEFAGLDPLGLPWKEMRKYPERFPEVHMAKIASARTVAGLDFALPDGSKRRIYLKRSFVRHPLRRLLAPFRASKEWREFRLAQQFSECGICVPEPVFYAEARQPEDRTPVTFLATLALSPEFQEARRYFLRTRCFAEEWEGLARYTADLHARQVLHADYRGAHIFLARKGERVEWALIDLDGSRVGKPVTRDDRVRAMRQLAESLLGAGLTEGDLARFFEVYDPEGRWRLDPKETMAFVRGKTSGR